MDLFSGSISHVVSDSVAIEDFPKSFPRKRVKPSEVVLDTPALQKEYFAPMPMWISEIPTKKCPNYAKRVYALLCKRIRAGHKKFPHQRLLAKEMGVSVRHFQRGLKFLVDLGWVSVTSHTRSCRPNGYKLHDNTVRQTSEHTRNTDLPAVHVWKVDDSQPIEISSWNGQNGRGVSSLQTTDASPLLKRSSSVYKEDLREEKNKREPEKNRNQESSTFGLGYISPQTAFGITGTCERSHTAGISEGSPLMTHRVNEVKYMNSNNKGSDAPRPKHLDDGYSSESKNKTTTRRVPEQDRPLGKADHETVSEDLSLSDRRQRAKATIEKAAETAIPNIDNRHQKSLGSPKANAMRAKATNPHAADAADLARIWKQEIEKAYPGETVIDLGPADKKKLSELVARSSFDAMKRVIRYAIRNWAKVFVSCTWKKKEEDAGRPDLSFVYYNVAKLVQPATIWATHEQTFAEYAEWVRSVGEDAPYMVAPKELEDRYRAALAAVKGVK